jgi:hypothetical protein
MKKYYLTTVILLLYLVPTFAQSDKDAEQKLDKDTKRKITEANAFYENKIIISDKQLKKPERLIGSIIYYRKGEEDSFKQLRIVPENKVKSVIIDEEIWADIIETKKSGSIKALKKASVSASYGERVEVVLTEKYLLTVPDLANDEELYKKVMEKASIVQDSDFEVKFIQALEVSELKYDYYKKISGDVKGSFMFIDVNGEKFQAQRKFSKQKFVALEIIDLAPFIKAYNKKNKK